MDAPVYARPAISLIASGIGPHKSDLYIGGSDGARDLELLKHHGISVVVNCAINLDINWVRERRLTMVAICGRAAMPTFATTSSA